MTVLAILTMLQIWILTHFDYWLLYGCLFLLGYVLDGTRMIRPGTFRPGMIRPGLIRPGMIRPGGHFAPTDISPWDDSPWDDSPRWTFCPGMFRPSLEMLVFSVSVIIMTYVLYE